MRNKDYFYIKQPSKIMVDIVRYLFFISLSYVLCYPLLYVLANSFKGISDIYDVTVNWIPKTLNFQNFIDAFKVFDVKHTMMNTVVYEIVAAMIQFCSCAVAAYGLARFNLKIKSLLWGVLILTILVPSTMIIIPSYVNYTHLDFFGILGMISKLIGTDLRPNLVGTPLVFYLPALTCVGLKGGLFIYIFAQFFKGLPKELEEAAAIDGAGSWKTFLRIVIPSSGPALITVLLFSIVWHWNDFYLAEMYMSEQTFSVALKNYNGSIASAVLGIDVTTIAMMDVQYIVSGCLLFLLPMLLFYIVIQRKFMASIATSGIVG